jgi:UDP-N-acetylglucosamine 2-epimerase (non-hydrolysing)
LSLYGALDLNYDSSMNILHVVGTRPNFIKAAPVYSALAQRGISQILVHTGQHYDTEMSEIFFKELGLPPPDVNLGVGSGSHASQTALVMTRFEPVLLEQQPDWVLVYGDVNSTLAAALVCAKLQVRVAHVEAGLRSRDRSMPEEINRLLTDQIADSLLTPSPDADDNLMREGIAPEKIKCVGNVMIDSLIRSLPLADVRWIDLRQRFSLGSFALVTLHRPSNVDDLLKLKRILDVLTCVSQKIKILFPIHPRTQRQIAEVDLLGNEAFRFIEPLGYLDFLALLSHAVFVVTDSGGIQEETTWLGIPCLTLRENTERPITVIQGTNILVGNNLNRLESEIDLILDGRGKRGSRPSLWDGNASERIAEVLQNYSLA